MDGATMKDLESRPPVEVTVTERCDHGCFAIWISAEAIWHLPGHPVEQTPPEKGGGFHYHDDDVECEDVCSLGG